MKQFFYLLIVITAFTACQKEVVDNTETTVIINPPQDLVTGSISGIVYESEDDNVPSIGAIVSLYEYETTTDGSGRFEFNNVDLFSDGTFLSVEKDGFFKGSRKFDAMDGDVHDVEVRLIKKEAIDVISSQTGGVVGDGNIQVELPSGVYNSDAGEYRGEIKVFAKWLDPMSLNFLQTMPGRLIGVENQEEIVSLSSLGMFIIVIEDESGNALSLPDGLTADITIPVSDALFGNVPSQVSLWSFDDDNSIWIRNGTATLNGDQYQLNINKLSYWNLSESYETASVTGTIFVDNEPLQNSQVRIRSTQSDYISFITTTDIGTYSISLPINQEFTLDLEGECLNTMYESMIGPFLENTSNNDTQLISTSEEINIQARALDCSGNPLSGTLVRLKYGDDNKFIRTDNDGQLNISIEDCLQEPIEIIALDLDNNMVSDVTFIYGQDDAEAIELMTCDLAELSQNVSYDGIDWSDRLMDEIESEWEISVIDGLDIIIFDISMSDSVQEYMHGAIRFEKEGSMGSFLLTFPTQGFRASGFCTLQKTEINEQLIYKFHEVSNVEILEIDGSIFPQVSAQSFEFDMTYFD